MKDIGLKIAILLALVAAATGFFYVLTRGVPGESDQVSPRNEQTAELTPTPVREVPDQEVEYEEGSEVDAELKVLDQEINDAFSMDSDPDPSFEL